MWVTKNEETSSKDGRTKKWAQLRTAGKERKKNICVEDVGRVRCARGSRGPTREVQPFAK
jgi:hypothetical protein